jgi:hypothetical protein
MKRMAVVAAAAALGGALVGGPVAAVRPNNTKSAVRNSLVARIKRGMDFAAFRRVALRDGWEPIAYPQKCRQQASQALCEKLPELANVSSGPSSRPGISIPGERAMPRN